MKILFIGDIVGRPGRETVAKFLPEIKKKHCLDLVIANGENLAGGLGMTIRHYDEMKSAGIDFFTSGNHIWKRKVFLPYLDDDNIDVIRPINYPKKSPGRGWAKIKVKGKDILIINAIGRAFFAEEFDSPYERIDEVLAKVKADLIVVDHHAEATSNKKLLAYYLDGRINAFVGTHTHVPTADAQILPKGTAYITDIGMTGVQHSSLGGDLDTFLEAELTQIPVSYEIAEGNTEFNAVLIEFDDKTNDAISIELIRKFMKYE